MNIEIERKFLVNNNSFLETYSKHSKISHAYIFIEDNISETFQINIPAFQKQVSSSIYFFALTKFGFSLNDFTL